MLIVTRCSHNCSDLSTDMIFKTYLRGKAEVSLIKPLGPIHCHDVCTTHWQGKSSRYQRFLAETGREALARRLALPVGSIIAAGRAYIDFAWLCMLNKRKNYLLTGLKRNIKYKVLERQSVLKSKGIISDQTILLTGPKTESR